MNSHFGSPGNRHKAMDPDNTSTTVSLLSYPENSERSIPAKDHSYSPTRLRTTSKVNQRFTKLVLPGLARCLISWTIIGAFYASLWRFKDRVLSPREKSKFDAVTVALSIALGLNIASALKGIALDLRWWILSMRKRSSREVDLILHCDSMTELLRLVFVAPRPGTIIVCLSWLFLNILVQAAIAVLGLMYSASPGIADIYREPGMNNVSIPNMTYFAPTTGRFGNNAFAESFAAHVLGDIGSSYNVSMLPEEPLDGAPWAANPAGFWNGTDHWEYVFLDSAPSPGASGARFLSIYSNRIVKSAGTCTTPPYRLAIDGQLAVVQLPHENRSVAFPALALGMESIYYLTTPMLDNVRSNGTCGPGCSNVKALEPRAGPPVDGSFVANSSYFFYDCNITVTSTPRDLAPAKAAVAAQAVALSGQKHPEFTSTKDEFNQFVAYNFGLPFGEAQNNSVTGMASLMSRFAIGVVSAAAQTNPPMFIQGSLPAQGVLLQFDSIVGFNLILVITGMLQLILVLVTALLISRIVIPGEVLLSHQEAIRKRFVLSA